MTTFDSASSSSAGRADPDLSDSLDIRLAVAGRLSPTALLIHRERAELAAVLAIGVPRTGASRTPPRPDSSPE